MADIFELFKKIQKDAPAANAPVTHMVVGLGNPGANYTFTRHNAGFLAIDYICQKQSVLCNRLKFKALVGEANFGSHRVLLMKPQTMMNLSGEAVREAADFYKITPENIIVLVDDINLDPGRVRIRKSGSAGGHNGLKSIAEHLGSDKYPRVRIGVGEKPSEYDLADWVLSRIPKEAEAKMFECFSWMPDIVTGIADGKTDDIMGRYNGKSAGEDKQ